MSRVYSGSFFLKSAYLFLRRKMAHRFFDSSYRTRAKRIPVVANGWFCSYIRVAIIVHEVAVDDMCQVRRSKFGMCLGKAGSAQV